MKPFDGIDNSGSIIFLGKQYEIPKSNGFRGGSFLIVYISFTKFNESRNFLNQKAVNRQWPSQLS